jgi:hypothetical protein
VCVSWDVSLVHLWFSTCLVQVVAVEQLLGIDCDEAAEEHRLAEIEAREREDIHMPANGGDDLVAYYEQLEASVVHD